MALQRSDIWDSAPCTKPCLPRLPCSLTRDTKAAVAGNHVFKRVLGQSGEFGSFGDFGQSSGVPTR